MARILVVDDEPNIPDMIACALSQPRGHQVDTARGGLPAIDMLRRTRYELVITDVRMSDADGFAVLEAAHALEHPPAVILITGFGSIRSAVEAMKSGAADYVTKPLDLAKLADAVARALAERPAKRPRAAAGAPPAGAPADEFCGLVGRSAPMQEVFRLIRQVAPADSTVLIAGESGTGKEMAARAIHAQSARRAGPFVAVDCGALPETILESELFGHVRGAFTGAVDDKTGLLEAANGGTVFLDEVGEMTPPVQQKLLRTLQERAVRPVGSTVVRKVDVRILAATNRDLPQLVAEGRFRQDLFYRLNVVPLRIPALAERREDIPLLAVHFARKHATRLRRRTPQIADTVVSMLQKTNWPGNVRQLENVIECAVTFADGDTVRPDHLPPDFIESFALAKSVAVRGLGDARPGGKPADVTPLGAAVRYLEHQMLTKALDAAGGNKEQAAGLLGIDRATLYRKMKAHRIVPHEGT